jgi:hypothetical protein
MHGSAKALPVRKVISYKSGDFDPVMEQISSRALIGGAWRFRASGPLSRNAIQIGGGTPEAWKPTFTVFTVPPQTLVGWTDPVRR